jgi:hypothetical protein
MNNKNKKKPLLTWTEELCGKYVESMWKSLQNNRTV